MRPGVLLVRAKPLTPVSAFNSETLADVRAPRDRDFDPVPSRALLKREGWFQKLCGELCHYAAIRAGRGSAFGFDPHRQERQLPAQPDSSPCKLSAERAAQLAQENAPMAIRVGREPSWRGAQMDDRALAGLALAELVIGDRGAQQAAEKIPVDASSSSSRFIASSISSCASKNSPRLKRSIPSAKVPLDFVHRSVVARLQAPRRFHRIDRWS